MLKNRVFNPDITVKDGILPLIYPAVTCLWLKGLPLLQPTKIEAGREQRIYKMPPSKDRSKLRSITYQGIADAMATQWG